MKLSPTLATILALAACTKIESYEEFNARYYREGAVLYEESTGSNTQEKLQNNYNFGIILVDMQPSFLKHIDPQEKKQLIQRQREVLTLAKRYDIPTLVFEFDGQGETISELEQIIADIPRTKTFTKERDDGFEIYHGPKNFEPDYYPSDWLQAQGVDAVYMMGINGFACVQETADSAKDLFHLQIATSNDVIASGTEKVSCPFESCDQGKASLSYFLQEGILDKTNYPFIKYLKDNKTKIIADNTELSY